MKTDVVIVVNPGSTSTKIALYGRNGEVTSQTIQHPQSELDQFKLITDQLDYRHQLITSFVNNYCASHQITIVGAVGRGGIVKPLKGGTYRVNEAFMEDARSGQYGEHASNLGSLLANRIKDEYGLTECFTVDPVSCNNLWPIAEVSGVPEIKRNGRGHPLNMKMTSRKVAIKQGIDFNTSKYVVAHLGGGISIALIVGGQLVDINDGLLGMGPFSPNRAGALRSEERRVGKECVRLCRSRWSPYH